MATSADNDDSRSDDGQREQTLPSSPLGDTDEVVDEIRETDAHPGGEGDDEGEDAAQDSGRNREESGATVVIGTTTVIVVLLIILLLILIF